MAGMMRNAVQQLFGGRSAVTGAPPQNPNGFQPVTQRDHQQQTARGQAATGEHTQLEAPQGQNDDGTGGEQKAAELPLDKYKDLWEAPTGADGKPVPAKQKKSFSLDPAKMMEYAGKQDFKRFVKPETLAAIGKGGEEGVTAIQQMIQDIGSGTFASSMTASSRLVEQALAHQREEFELMLPDLVRKHSLKDSVRSKNPVSAHPAAQPIVNALQSQLASKHPEATAAELTDMVEEYLTTFASEFSGKKATETTDTGGKRGQRQEEDWSNFA